MNTPALPSRARAALVAGLISLAMLGGCTSTPSDPRDPLEPMNRVFYQFNMAFDTTLLKPAAEVYRWALPQPVRTGFNNFVENFRDIWRVVNGLLQGDLPRAGDYFGRIVVNTTVGVLGIFDAATDLGIKGGPNDLGMTFAKWGIGDGPYLEVPFLGPSTARDATGTAIEAVYDPLWWALYNAGWKWQWGQFWVRYINARSRLLDTDKLIADSLDPYAFRRDSYFQFRRSLVTPTGKTEGEGEGADGVESPREGARLAPPVETQPAEAALPQVVLPDTSAEARESRYQIGAVDIEEPVVAAPAI
ncbi:MAG: MlaA family lipoprotein [Burkholderiales bacterium]